MAVALEGFREMFYFTSGEFAELLLHFLGHCCMYGLNDWREIYDQLVPCSNLTCCQS